MWKSQENELSKTKKIMYSIQENKWLDRSDERKKEQYQKFELVETNFQEDNQTITLPKTILSDPSYAFFRDISIFCFSQQGQSHIKSNIPCQDRSGFKVIRDKVVIAAIADGVGSCSFSDYGAEIAVKSSLDFLEKHFLSELKQDSFKFDIPSIMGKVLREMMRYAYEEVKRKAEEYQQLPYSFQSTLTVAVYDGNTLYFAHAGDDGIVALNKMGTYAMVTSRHKGEEASSVYPLQSQNTWQFGKVDNTVAFVMATDGVLDAFVRPLSENNRVYYPFIEPVFYNHSQNIEDAKQDCGSWYEYMASPSYRACVTDDLTFVGVVNQSAIQMSVRPIFEAGEWERQTREYQKKRKEALYPSKEKTKPLPETEPVIGRQETDTIKQTKGAAPKMNKGMKEFVEASASILLREVGRATSNIGGIMEQLSENLEKKYDK